MGELLHNCRTCRFRLTSNECRIVLLDDIEAVDDWFMAFDLDDLEPIPEDADGCPGWEAEEQS